MDAFAGVLLMALLILLLWGEPNFGDVLYEKYTSENQCVKLTGEKR